MSLWRLFRLQRLRRRRKLVKQLRAVNRLFDVAQARFDATRGQLHAYRAAEQILQLGPQIKRLARRLRISYPDARAYR